MPNSNLFAVSNKGRIFTLQTDKVIWKELPYLGIDFKRVSAHDSVIWALGGDHQIYVFVYGTSVPIRVCEEAYENQRWNPIEGFAKNLLVTDRPGFSCSDGLAERKLSSVHLPSLAWSWEGPWHLQDTFEGKALDKECWTYAVDFPRSYTAEKKWKSCVRRRKWIRYRRYVALDTWSSVQSIHKDHTEEPFIDICVGGGEVMGEDSDHLMVWGITALGKVMVREGISANSPEGCKWSYVPTPVNQDLTSIAASRSGRVWAVTWDGSALVRTGITRNCPLGVGWHVVQPPESLSIQQIAVGVSVVWAICRDYSVWFRRGLTYGENVPSNISDNSDVGHSWLKMVGLLKMISIGPNDQVLGLASDDNSLVIRTGITPSELTGKTWKIINLPLLKYDPDKTENYFEEEFDLDLSQSICDTLQSKDLSVAEETNEKMNSSQDDEYQDAVSMNFDTSIQEHTTSDNSHCSNNQSEPKLCELDSQVNDDNTLTLTAINNEISLDNDISISNKEMEQNENLSSSEFSQLKIRNPEDYTDSLTSSVISDTVINFIGSDYCNEDIVPSEIKNDALQFISQDETCQEAIEIPFDNLSLASHINKPLVPKSGRSTTSSISSEVLHPKEELGSFGQEEQPFYAVSIPEENIWMWVTAGGCWLHSNNLPKWFIADYSNFNVNEPWRQSIIELLDKRKKIEVKDYTSYSEAIESSSWLITGQCRFLAQGHWVPATIELQTIGSRGCQVQEASFTVIYSFGSKKKVLISCCSVVLSTITVDLPAKSMLSLYTSNQPLSPLSFCFSAEKDAEEWINNVSSACTNYRGLEKRPSACSIWAINSHGFIYVHDFASSEQEMRVESRAAHKILDVKKETTPICHSLERGFRPGCFITVKGKVLEKADRFSINLVLDEDGYNTALHFNPRFDQKVIVMNTKENGVWSYEERKPLKPLAREKEFEFTILSDDRHMKISINGTMLYRFNHRLMPGDISFIKVEGDISVSGMVYNYGAGERTMRDYYWQGVGGHLRAIEGGAAGVTWAVSYDSHVYTYTGATGGGFYKGNSTDAEVNLMSDIKHFYVWENQRWNPLTGFTNRGLPTDRNTWSDKSGRHPQTKEGTKLPSRHWQWISDWNIDHHTPDGVDKDGWQYATDFPMAYHGHRYVTDLVRRRRWYRKCRISTSGPWKQIEKVMLVAVSVSPQSSEVGDIPVWGITVSNEVVMREGVTSSSAEGIRWSLIPSETPMKEIFAAIDGVWAISLIGQAHFRIGVTKSNPKGYDWVNIDAPTVPLKQIGFGQWKVWAIDVIGNLYYRVNVQPLFPEGTEWQRVCGDVGYISVSADGSLWAILNSYVSEDSECVAGVLARRNGIGPENPGGTSWDICTGIGWTHVSARMTVP